VYQSFNALCGKVEMLDSAWKELNTRETILFLGSGFSREAINKSDERYLDRKELASRLSRVLGDEVNESLTLREVSDDFCPDRQADLNQTLQPLMTTLSISSDQAEIINHRWRRVYTTNYDDVFEFGLLESKDSPESISFFDPLKKLGKATQVIHLHGYIHKCSDEDIDEKLVLTERSYVR
jgi:hypothetical protein